MGFWSNFWGFVKKKIDQYEDKKQTTGKVQLWEDVREYNPLAIANTKLTSLVCDEATVELQTDSTVAEALVPLAEDLEAKRYDICSMMNGKGGAFVTLATREDAVPYHRIIAPADVSVYKMSADKIYEAALVIDKKTIKNKEYRLVRYHMLDDNGTLYIYYYTTDKNGNEEYLAEWERFQNDNVMYLNANNIGIAYFKSPQDSRGLSPIWGVPLNFGCEETEAKLKKARKDLDGEMELMKAKIFADESIVRKIDTQNGERYDIPEGIYTIRKKAGVDGTLVDSFAPATRYADFKQNKTDAETEWENTVGLDRGFLSEAERTSGATATEIRTANTKTRSFVKRLQSAMFDGIKATLEADAVFLNVAKDLYSVVVDWFDAFQDEAEQYTRIASAVDRGILEKEDELAWLYPNMSEDERKEKLQRIKSEKALDVENRINDLVGGV